MAHGHAEKHFEQLVVHVYSVSGNWLAGHDARAEPTYFFERCWFTDINT